MPIEMPRGLPFSVDTWSPSSDRKRHHFLTHAHRDHSQGISANSSYPIYATRLTKTLTLQYYPQLSDLLFVEMEVGESVVVDDPDSSFKVTAFDANHCPGAVMFLFEGTFGNILHTGDCRLTPECLQNLPEKYLGKESKGPKCRLDYVFLDCTFGNSSMKMPSKHLAIRQVINCIWKHPDAPLVYLTCDLLGQEDILVNVSRAFGSKIYINKERNPECYQSLGVTVSGILSQDPSSRFHIFNAFPNLSERAEVKFAEARTNRQPEPLIIRPSAQWYVFEDVSTVAEKRSKKRFSEAVRDQFGIWHVCYSMHSSRAELEWALQLLAPRWVVSTTPSCRAVELSYVKKHCSYTQLASDDPLWKLLGINGDCITPIAKDVAVEGSMTSSIVKACVESWLKPQEPSVSTNEKLVNLSPPRMVRPVTLFGRARLGLNISTLLHEEIERDANHTIPSTSKELVDKDTPHVEEDVLEVHGKNLLQRTEVVDLDVGVSETQLEKSTEDVQNQIHKKHNYHSPIFGSPKSLSENTRKFYRTMNVPVPRPLPSLMELLNDRRRVKRRLYCSTSFH